MFLTTGAGSCLGARRSRRTADGAGRRVPWLDSGRGSVGPGVAGRPKSLMGWNLSRFAVGKSVVIGCAPSSSHAPVAQLDRVPGYEPGGREFESLRARHIEMKRASNRLRFEALFISIQAYRISLPCAHGHGQQELPLLSRINSTNLPPYLANFACPTPTIVANSGNVFGCLSAISLKLASLKTI